MDVTELIDKVADGLPVKKEFVKNIIAKIVEEIVAEVTKGYRVHIRGFGAFQSMKMAARVRRNPKTGLRMSFPATITVKFHPSPKFRDTVSAKRSPKP